MKIRPRHWKFGQDLNRVQALNWVHPGCVTPPGENGGPPLEQQGAGGEWAVRAHLMLLFLKGAARKVEPKEDIYRKAVFKGVTA